MSATRRKRRTAPVREFVRYYNDDKGGGSFVVAQRTLSNGLHFYVENQNLSNKTAPPWRRENVALTCHDLYRRDVRKLRDFLTRWLRTDER